MKCPVMPTQSHPQSGAGHSSYIYLTCNLVGISGQFLSRILNLVFPVVPVQQNNGEQPLAVIVAQGY